LDSTAAESGRIGTESDLSARVDRGNMMDNNSTCVTPRRGQKDVKAAQAKGEKAEKAEKSEKQSKIEKLRHAC
jgi:hypothetical protein